MGILSDHFGRWRMVLIGWTLYAAVYFGFALADMRMVWWLFPLYGLFMGLTDGVSRALVRDYIPEEKKGTAMGIFQMAIGGMALAGSLVAGLLWDLFGSKAPFLLGSAVALTAVVVALFVMPKERRETNGLWPSS